tara:strand:- start:522 stop:1466 length:945 start_codon:yes stop_codon:yes gene_type:complete
MNNLKSQKNNIKSITAMINKSLLIQIPWTLVKVIIYLLVAYSVFFTISLSWVAYQTYEYLDEQLDSVRIYKTENPIQSNYMKLVKAKLPKDSSNLKQDFIPIKDIAIHLKNAVLAVEDASFYQHPGIHMESILNAMETNKKRGKKTHGGSTISQQLAKNLFLTPEKTMVRKAKEAVYTLLMEKYLGKERILELYLNYAQWGKNIFGCQAASQHYFKKSCKNISFKQSVQLASILANPVKYHPLTKGSVLLSQRRRIIYENFYTTRKISLETFEAITGDKPRKIKEDAYRQTLIEIKTKTMLQNEQVKSETAPKD